MSVADKITLDDGRVLETRELGPGEMLDLMEAAGNASDNAGWLRMAFVICSVAAIDGVPVPMPATKKDVRALAVRVGNDGMVALNGWAYGPKDDASSSAVDVAKN